MTTVADVVHLLGRLTPFELAEPWDNVGLIWGDPASPVSRVMTCLTVCSRTAAEAIRERAELIISHHPVLFREVKKIRSDDPTNGFLWSLARAGVSVASPHTAFDNAAGGINDLLCDRLGLIELEPLRPVSRPIGSGTRRFKVIVFTPESDREAVMDAAFESGAGRIGAYSECSFAIAGQGTFRGDSSANPTIGEPGRRETVAELRLEFVCPAARLAAVLASIRERHSYEEPAIDVQALEDEPQTGPPAGAGRVGRLSEARPLEDFARQVASTLESSCLQVVGEPKRTIARVAVCCGAGDDFLPDAHRARADVLLTGEARFHRGLEAQELGLALITAGHHATERPGIVDLAHRLKSALPGVAIWPSQDEIDPFQSTDPTTRLK